MGHPCRRVRRAMTLLEVLLALGLIVLVSGMMFMFYEAAMRSRDNGIRVITDLQLARVIAMKIAEEVRSSNGFVLGGGTGVGGDSRMLRLQTVVLPDKELMIPRSIEDDPPPAESDIREVQYYLAYDDEESFTYPDGTDAAKPLGLVRRSVKTLNQVILNEEKSESVDLDLLAPELKYVRFRFFDGVDWVDKWDLAGGIAGIGNTLPQAVEITVGYTPLPPEDDDELELTDDESDLLPSPPEPYSPQTYTVMVLLPQADKFFGSRLMRAQRVAGKRAASAAGG